MSKPSFFIENAHFRQVRAFIHSPVVRWMSAADPHFARSFPRNSRACNTRSLTSLRALLWLHRYGREDEPTALLFRYLRSFLTYCTQFQQELNSFDGSPI